MENTKNNAIDDLYKKVLPALYSKVCELHRRNIFYIKEADIWAYLCKEYWHNTASLSLGEMVNDILSTPIDNLEKYLLKKSGTSIKKNEQEEQDALL